MTFRHCVAVDLGASSGRVMLARYDSKHRTLTLREIHRFVNYLQKTEGFDTWDIDSLEKNIRLGLKKVCDEGILIDSIGIDTWGVDYVLLDKHGQRVGLPVSYRDNRTTGIMPQALAQLGKSNIYRRSGIQFLPFNTVYQLRALTKQQPELTAQVAHALLMPDYFSYRLTGEMNWEYTNATTTQLVNINTDDWDDTLLAWTGAKKSWFGRPMHPGNVIGDWICPQGNRIPVVAVASHDTASAVIASPLANKHSAYLSSGTWSLMGFENKMPYTTDDALAANITNEGGAEGRYRVLKNIMGLWLLQRVLKERRITDLPALIAQTEALPACRFLINRMTIALSILTICALKSRPPVARPTSRSRQRCRTGALHFRQSGAAVCRHSARTGKSTRRSIYPTAYCWRRLPERATQPVVRRCLWYLRDGWAD
ncbi:rhamnulokinase [Salmonella enterica subsp. arizonae]|nr:rhamnulokinase [Salmonella enterica subsp. arizonae]